jgi:hypothetical protein
MSGSKKIYENFLGRELKSNEYLYLPPATAMKREDIKKSCNISFIGTNFFPSFLDYQFINLAKIDNKLVSSLHNDLKDNYFYKVEDLYKNKYQQYNDFADFKEFCEIKNLVDRLYVGQNRLEYLSLLEDLGLIIYGVSWNQVYSYDIKLLNSLNNKKILSIKDNEDVYNSSKISINISHPQATTAFSWRVTDIMSSSSCLVIENKPDWHDLFGRLISEKVKDAIIYKDRFDARNKCIELLKNEKLRQQCVEECNSAIEINGRWSNRFKLIEEFCVNNLGKTTMRLVGSKNDVSYEITKLDKHSLDNENVGAENHASYEITKLDKHSLDNKDLGNIGNSLEAINRRMKKIKFRYRIANIFGFLILTLGQIPIIDKLIINKSSRKFLYRLIDKNKR